MAAYGIYTLLKAHKLSYLADVIGTVSLEGFDGRIEPFNELIHAVRPHDGQLKTARRIKNLLKDSALISQEKQHVQDPYSFRCMPQVHGATKDTIRFVTKTFLTEVNSVTDNPNIFVEEDEIISGGNFHGQPLALGLDFLAIAISELGKYIRKKNLSIGFWTPTFTSFFSCKSRFEFWFYDPTIYGSEYCESEHKQYATPASVDSIESSNGQEDHVSMGANAATKCKKVVDNLQNILAIELVYSIASFEFWKRKNGSFFRIYYWIVSSKNTHCKRGPCDAL